MKLREELEKILEHEHSRSLCRRELLNKFKTFLEENKLYNPNRLMNLANQTIYELGFHEAIKEQFEKNMKALDADGTVSMEELE